MADEEGGRCAEPERERKTFKIHLLQTALKLSGEKEKRCGIEKRKRRSNMKPRGLSRI